MKKRFHWMAPLNVLTNFEQFPTFHWKHKFCGISLWRNIAIGFLVRVPK